MEVERVVKVERVGDYGAKQIRSWTHCDDGKAFLEQGEQRRETRAFWFFFHSLIPPVPAMNFPTAAWIL